MTDQALDNLARQVMLDAARLEYGSLIEELPEHDFSPEFEKKMKKLLRQGRHPVRYRTLRAAACLLLVLFLSGCAVLAISPEIREVFAGWVREIHDNYFLYEFFGNGEREAVSEEDVLYQPAYVPAGYRIERRTVLTGGVVTIGYINDQTNDIAVFTCFSDTSSAVLQVSGENEIICRQVRVNGLSADLYLDSEEGEANVIVWVDEQNGAAFRISGVLSGEELTRMAESVRAVPWDVSFYPSWLPEGYYDVTTDDLRRQRILRYEDGKGGLLTILCPSDFDTRSLMLAGEADLISVFVGENPADLYLDRIPGNASSLVWVDRDTGILVWISGPLTGEELIRIGESMEKREGPPLLEEYQLTWTPYGYQEAERSLRENRGHVLYRDERGRQITLAYRRGSETAGLQISSALGGTLEDRPVTVDGAPADLYLEKTQEAGNALVWARDGLLFWMIAPCSQEELIAMAESVEVLTVEYRLTWVPECYALYMQNDTFGNTISCLYKNPEGRIISFLYQPDREKARMYLIPNEDSTEKRVSVHGNPGDLYLAEPGGPQSELVWWDPEMEALCTISASVPKEDLLKMAESIEAAAPSPKVRQPSWLPMGYRYAGGSAGSSSMERRYKNENGDEILFVFLGPPEAEKREKLRETVKGLESQSVLVNGQAAELYSAPNGVLNLIWNGREPEEIFQLSAALDAETLIEVAESVFYPS